MSVAATIGVCLLVCGVVALWLCALAQSFHVRNRRDRGHGPRRLP